MIDFFDIDEICCMVEYCNGIEIYFCYFYVGDFVYMVFFGMYQDVIKKGFVEYWFCVVVEGCLEWQIEWWVLYLLVDFVDIGCSYDVVICVNF